MTLYHKHVFRRAKRVSQPTGTSGSAHAEQRGSRTSQSGTTTKKVARYGRLMASVTFKATLCGTVNFRLVSEVAAMDKRRYRLFSVKLSTVASRYRCRVELRRTTEVTVTLQTRSRKSRSTTTYPALPTSGSHW